MKCGSTLKQCLVFTITALATASVIIGLMITKGWKLRTKLSFIDAKTNPPTHSCPKKFIVLASGHCFKVSFTNTNSYWTFVTRAAIRLLNAKPRTGRGLQISHVFFFFFWGPFYFSFIGECQGRTDWDLYLPVVHNVFTNLTFACAACQMHWCVCKTVAGVCFSTKMNCHFKDK